MVGPPQHKQVFSHAIAVVPSYTMVYFTICKPIRGEEIWLYFIAFLISRARVDRDPAALAAKPVMERQNSQLLGAADCSQRGAKIIAKTL